MTDRPPDANDDTAEPAFDFARSYDGAPDPVELFAATLEQALHQLRVEVAGLRAERDGLRLESEGLRAVLGSMQHQLQQRAAPSPAAAVPPGIVVSDERTIEAPAPSALDELRAMGLWPPPPAPEHAPVVAPAIEPVVEAADVGEVAPEAEAVRSRRRRWVVRLLAVIGVVAVLAVLFVSLGPRVLPFQTYFVRSGSMEPAIETGALVFLTRADASTLGEGDIITFERPDRAGTLVTHRIVGIEDGAAGPVFVTQGDANETPDPWRVPATGDGWKYAFDVPLLGSVFGFVSTPEARLLLLALPAAVFGLLSLADMWRPRPGKRST